MILIMGQNIDPHIQKTKDLLDKSGSEYYVFDHQNCYENHSLSYHINSNKFDFSFCIGEKIIDYNNIRSVWWRLKPPIIQPKETVEHLNYQALKNREWIHSLRPLYENIPAKWINNLDSHYKASYKIHQLDKAVKMGFSIPNTIVSNDTDKIKGFIEAHKPHSEVIYKPLTYYYELPDKVTMTTTVSSALVDRINMSVKVTPGIFQKKITKKYELRITVVGEEIFPVRIDTAGIPEAETDWRNDIYNVKYSITDIPESFRNRLLKLHKSFGLIYGAYDFIVSQDNNLFFLEVNPAGQWLWMENLIDLQITKALVREMIN
ncbi:MAG: hypothetical protein N3I35_07040 [Clostridia bacterium]|nr:hypothetical protein [Clostridia bacterium]